MTTKGLDNMNSETINDQTSDGHQATPKRAVIYAHVAAESQEVGQTTDVLTLQVNACKGNSQERGYTLGHIYQEIGSTNTLNRPMLRQLRQAACNKEFDVLVLWDLTRLARRTHQQGVIMRELNEAGITIQSVCDGEHEGERIEDLITMLQNFAAETEREQIRARRSGKKATKKTQREQ